MAKRVTSNLPVASEEVQTLAFGILRALNVALKITQLYTQSHPSMGNAIAQLRERYELAMVDHLLVNLTFTGDTIAVNDGELPTLDTPLRRLSRHLHQIGIATLSFAPGADDGALQHLIEVLATPRQQVLEAGSIEALIDKARLGAVRILPLDYTRVFRVAANGLPSPRELIDADGLWYAMITGYVVRRPEELDGEARDFITAFAADPRKLRHLADELSQLQLDEQWIEVGKVKGSLLANFYRSLGSLLHGQQGTQRQAFLSQIARGTEALRPLQLVELLTESDDDEADPGNEIVDELIAAFRPDRAAELLMAAAGEADEGEMVRLVERLLTVHPQKKRILDLLDQQTDTVRQLKDGNVAQAEALRTLCRRFADTDYLSILQEPSASSASDYIEQLRSLDEDRDLAAELLQGLLLDVAEREQASLYLALLEVEDDPEQFTDQLSILKQLVSDAVESQAYDVALAILDGLRRLELAGSPLTENFRAQTAEWLAKLDHRPLIATLVMDYGQYGGTPAERDVNQCIAALGAPAIDCLLDLLKDSGDRAQRRAILTLLKNQGNGILPQVQQRLEDPVWYFVRNLLHLLGELGQEESARLLIPLLNHGDHRVVKEALAGLGQIGSRNATPFIARLLLTEPALATKKHDEVRITAARTLARIGDQRALDTLRRGTFVRRPAVARVCEETLRDSSSRTAARGDGGGARR
ncbi:MAG: hypothetical protein PVF51_09755 [Nitrospirota bacterium]|jgi:hypothetical protein